MKRLLLVLVALLLSGGVARAQDLKDRFNIKLSLSGLYVTETQDQPDKVKNNAATFSLGYADLRAVIDARRLPLHFDLHIDGRVRISPDDYSVDKAQVAANQVTSRGYLGGREYELRSAYFKYRGNKVDFAFGRQWITESDALKIDGLRLWYRFAKHWDLSIYAGGYPNPYSRSLTTDYQGANGYYGTAIAAGGDVSYTYDKVWGAVSISGAYLGGLDDGIDGSGRKIVPDTVNKTQELDGLKPATEVSRVYLTWNGLVRFASWFDVYHDLVLDVLGSGGVQLTRLDVLATARAGKYFTLRGGYDHMSALAIEMFLAALLAQKADFLVAPSITNNLILSRTARDQAYLGADAHFGKVNIFAEGRLRLRSIANAGEDPQFVVATNNSAAPTLAYDITVGIRDRGSLKGLRAGLWYTFLNDYRSGSYVLGVELGRSFLDERLTFDLGFLYARTIDQASGPLGTMCSAPMTTPNGAGLIVACYGTRDGASYEPGLTFTTMPFKHWFGMIDYRLVLNETAAQPMLVTHVLLLRLEARY